MKVKHIKIFFPFLLGLFFFSSCIGLSMDIHLRRNGSGRLTLEYKIPSALQNIGRLDGNQNWPVIPVSRQDWERSLSRSAGLKLSSFSSRERGNDQITNVIIDFDNTEALCSFLNSSASGNKIDIIISEYNPGINADLLELIREAGDYELSFGFSHDSGISSLTVIDSEGNDISVPPSSKLVQTGRKTVFIINTADVFSRPDGLGVRISWQR